MKTKILILLLAMGCGLVTSCKNDDDQVIQQEAINGTWNLKNVRGGLQGIDIDYAVGEVKWNFNSEENTLIIENNIITTGPEDIYAGRDSGTYIFSILQNGDIEILSIDNTERGVLSINGTTLSIDDGIAADGFITSFERQSL